MLRPSSVPNLVRCIACAADILCIIPGIRFLLTCPGVLHPLNSVLPVPPGFAACSKGHLLLPTYGAIV